LFPLFPDAILFTSELDGSEVTPMSE